MVTTLTLKNHHGRWSLTITSTEQPKTFKTSKLTPILAFYITVNFCFGQFFTPSQPHSVKCNARHRVTVAIVFPFLIIHCFHF
uniref:Ovule protein n=1 Tax=Panagrellus redivivus TaxID=6233 RepID=A0A7E4UN27_PANRE